MNPKIKEALSFCNQKDAETEKICTFIADFIKDYGYLLLEDNTIKFCYQFFYPGEYTDAFYAYKYSKNTIKLTHPKDSNISRCIATTFNDEIFRDILVKEGAIFFSKKDLTYNCATIKLEKWYIGFEIL